MNAEVDVSGICLETPRVRLRAWKESDLQDLFDYASMEDIGRMAGWKRHTCLEESSAILQLFIQEKKTFAIECKENGKVVGSIGLEPLKADVEQAYPSAKGREIGYVLHKDNWGKGMMPEAVREVIRYCFEEEHYDFLCCGHFNFNHQSQRVIEKLGFRYWKDAWFSTQYNDGEAGKLYVLTKEEYERKVKDL